MFTIEEVCELSGFKPQTLRNWISGGLITPEEPGEVGAGKGHRFTLMQAVGLVVAKEIQDSERGCVLSFIGMCVENFNTKSEEWLKRRLARGSTHYVMPHHSGPLLDGDGARYGWANVKAAYDKVSKLAAKKAR